MKNIHKVIAIILALSCLFSTTAFAIDSNEFSEGDFVPGDVIIIMVADLPENVSYESLLPEIDIKTIETTHQFDNGETWLCVVLSEQTEQATINAIEALKDNKYVRDAGVNGYGYGDDENAIVIGDANCDGAVTNTDLILVARQIVGLEEFNGNQRANADIDIDNEITNADLIAIAQMIVGAV